MELDALVRQTLNSLLRELVDGPPGDFAFILNPGDRGLLGSLDSLTAADASRRPDGRSSVAAHVDHVRYGFELLNRWAGGADPFGDADYAASWRRQSVTEEQWRDLRAALGREAHAWMGALATPREWDEAGLAGAVSSIAHLGYHVGAIRQLAAAAAGPKAKD